MKKTDLNKEESVKYYDLKTEHVDELVKALKEESPKETPSLHKQYTKNKAPDQPDPYKIDKLAMIPAWVKAAFIKFWVAGAICYFFLFSFLLSSFAALDKIVFTGIILGIIFDLIVNPMMLYFESEKLEYHPYILLPYSAKKLWTLLINVPVGILIVWLINLGYSILIPNIGIINGVEPISFGLMYLIIDMAIVSIRNLIIKTFLKMKNKIE